MQWAGRAATAAIAVVAVACGGGGGAKAAPPPTTTVTTAAAATTTVAPAVAGTDDNAVRLRLLNAATVEFTVYTDAQAFTADPAKLSSVDPTLTFGTGLAPPARPQVVDVVVSPDNQWACLTGQADTGHVFVVVAGPHVDTYQASMPLTACNATVAGRLPKVSG